MISDGCTEKMQRCQEYVESLEEERRKIQVFERELPLCLELVTQAIETCKQQLYFHGQSECSEESEQTSSEGPVLEEFLPIKRTSSSDDDEQQSHKSKNNDKDNKNHEKCSKKSDWLRSVQLWNQTPDSPTREGSPRKVSVTEVKRNGGGAFHPFKKEKREKSSVGTTPTAAGRSSSVPAAVASLTAETGGCSKKEEKEGEESQRKARRCWSQELHRRFLHALQKLGGSHVATPKQIRELMKVDGLTNDEVKSHLQKYRLHTRRPTPSIHNNNNPQAPEFVVVGGIWVPPREYSAVAKTASPGEAAEVANPNGIFAPIAAPSPLRPMAASQAQRKHHKQSMKSPSSGRAGRSEGGVHSNSPASSSSTHTSTASPAL